MSPAAELQPDQRPDFWDRHVDAYEAVFEPLSNAFARRALDLIGLRSGERLLDVGAGSGGAALIAAERGSAVLAVDASQRMVQRIRERAGAAGLAPIEAEVMDGMALSLPDGSIHAAISVFGVILFPDAARGMQEIARVLRPGGRAAVVTWTESERYELVSRLIAAVARVRGPQPPPAMLPAQLRFRDPDVFRELLAGAGMVVERVERAEERWRLPSARWLTGRLAFAPGMAAMVGSLGPDRAAVLEAFATALEAEQGRGEISLRAVAQIGVAAKPGGSRQGEGR
jgi:SAM-dependent methyltransferase